MKPTYNELLRNRVLTGLNVLYNFLIFVILGWVLPNIEGRS